MTDIIAYSMTKFSPKFRYPYCFSDCRRKLLQRLSLSRTFVRTWGSWTDMRIALSLSGQWSILWKLLCRWDRLLCWVSRVYSNPRCRLVPYSRNISFWGGLPGAYHQWMWVSSTFEYRKCWILSRFHPTSTNIWLFHPFPYISVHFRKEVDFFTKVLSSDFPRQEYPSSVYSLAFEEREISYFFPFGFDKSIFISLWYKDTRLALQALIWA